MKTTLTWETFHRIKPFALVPWEQLPKEAQFLISDVARELKGPDDWLDFQSGEWGMPKVEGTAPIQLIAARLLGCHLDKKHP